MTVDILVGDCVEQMRHLEPGSVHTCVTSPPYFGLRDYGVEGQIGLEQTPDEYVAKLVEVFREVRRVLRDDGTLWLNLGDSYRKDKNRLLIPARCALALQADGWLLRDEIVWHKTCTTPAPVKDRTCAAHEMIYMFAKRPRYYYDYLAIEEPAKCAGATRKNVRGAQGPVRGSDTKYAGREVTVRNTRRKRSVWSVSPGSYKGAHFAAFPPALIEPCVLAGCPEGGTVLDPFGGSGTTRLVAKGLRRNAVLCELNPEYAEMARGRIGEGAFVL